MADSVLFDGVNDFIEFALNAGAGITSWCSVFIAKRTDDTSSWRQMGYIAENSIGAKMGMGIDGSAAGQYVLDLSSTQALWTSGAAAALSNDQNWRLYAANNPGGSNNVHATIWDYVTETWLVTADTPDSGGNPLELDLNIGDAVFFGAWPDSGLTLNDFFLGNILAAGYWYNTVLDFSSLEALRFSLDEWLANPPNVGWRFDQTVGTYIGTDSEPGLQTSGGTVEDDSPAGWFDAGGPPPALKEIDYSEFKYEKLRRAA